MKNKNTIEKNNENKLKDFYEQHPSKLQFWTNIGLIVITLLTLLATSYYSKNNLDLSTKQYKSTINQFNYLRSTDSLKSIADQNILKKDTKKALLDSALQVRRDSLQELRNKNQDILNARQLEINRQQLSAIKIQASTAQNQFSEQENQYKQQQYEKRPVFVMDNVKIDSSKNYIKQISFTFSNKGFRTSHVDSTVLAFYNPRLLCFSVTKNNSNLDLIPSQTTLFTSWVNIYNDCLNDNLTIYYLLIYYKDTNTGQNQIEPIFFKYGFTKEHQFYYTRIFGQIKQDFISLLKKKNIFIIE